MTIHRCLSIVALCSFLAAAGSAEAQFGSSTTSTTTTKSKTTTQTTTESWKTPDGTKGGSSTTTTTSTRSQSKTVGTPSSGARPQPAPTLPAPGPSAGVQWMAGAWSASEGARRGACRVQLYTGLESGGGATSSGCQSDIKGIGNWALRGNTLLLIKNVFTTAATLHQTGPSRFEGSTASGERIAIWR